MRIDIPLQCHEAHRTQSDGEFCRLPHCNHPQHLAGDASASGVTGLLIRQLLFEGVQKQDDLLSYRVRWRLPDSPLRSSESLLSILQNLNDSVVRSLLLTERQDS